MLDCAFGVIGAGKMGRVFARRLAKLGYPVLIASSRQPAELSALAAELGAEARSVVEVVSSSQVIFLAIPTKAVPALPRGLFSGYPRHVVIDVTNYHPELRDGRIDAIERGGVESQWVSAQLGHPVVKAFNGILAESLEDKAAPRGAAGRLALPVAGDVPEAVARVLRLVDEFGFDPVPAGTLNDSWRQQTGTPAYCCDLDAAALKRALAQAERAQIVAYRSRREASLRRGIAVDT